MMNKRHFQLNFLVFCLLFIVGLIFAFRTQSIKQQRLSDFYQLAATPTPFDYQKEIDIIKQILKDFSYKEALVYAGKLPISYREYHTVAHFIGQDMFKHFGPDGVAKCFDSSLQDPYFGCAHGFLSEAVRQTDYNFPRLEAACRKIELSNHASNCFHIIGHTLLHNLGFNDEGFIKANEICNQASNADIRNRCKDGTVMEITFARLGPDGRGQVEKLIFDENNPYYPCNLTDHINCYTLKPEYWLRTLKLPVSQITTYCIEAPSKDAQEQCFWGLGVMMWSESYVKAKDSSGYKQLLETNLKNCTDITLASGREKCKQGFDESYVKMQDGTYRDVRHMF